MNSEEEERRLAHLSKEADDVVTHDSEDEADEYDWCTPIRSSSGLETALSIAYPYKDDDNGNNKCPPFELSTCMDETLIAPMFHGTQWAGTRIWPAAVECLEYLLSLNNDDGNNNAKPLVTTDTTVLELGCGLGLPGMLLQLIRNCSVTLTDKADLVPQLRQNLDQDAFLSRKIEAHTLDWSETGVDELLQKAKRAASSGNSSEEPRYYDVVMNCDCVYVPLYGNSYKALVAVQLALLQKNPHTVLLTSLERRRVDGVELYLADLKASDLVDRVEKVFSKGKIEIYRAFGRV